MTSEPRAFIVRGDDGQEYGPVDLEEMREWAVENRVGLGTEVRRDGVAGEWEPWQHFPELVALLAQVQASGRSLPPLPQAMPVLAPLGRRSVALLLDFLFAILLMAPPSLVLYWLQPMNLLIQQQLFFHIFVYDLLNGLNPPEVLPPFGDIYMVGGNILEFFLPLLYFAGFHAAHGRTPAKSILHLQVVDSSGRKPTLGMALLRGFILMVSVNLYGLPLLYAFFHPQRRALHDIAAGTYVVER